MEELRWEGGRWVYGAQILACSVVLYSRSRVAPKSSPAIVDKARFPVSFTSFQRTFLLVFFLATGSIYRLHQLYNVRSCKMPQNLKVHGPCWEVADALQGVYSEALYESYGLRRKEIASLLAVGYGSSLFLGTFFAASADYIGRKRACMLYGIFQAIGCLAKQSSNFHVLCWAHVSLGIANSLLFSSFETWMVVEHEKMGYKQEWLSETFWLMAFCTGVAATGSGALANVMMQWQGFTGSAPLAAAGVISVLGIIAVSSAFNENIGNSSSSIWRPLVQAVQSLHDNQILLLGWAQVCFDFSIIIFWFLWTPTLVADGREVHSGLIYTRLIASMILGTTIAAYLLHGPYYLRPESFLSYVLLVGGLSLFLPAWDHQEIRVLLWCFCIFHICVGIALPSLARLRSIYISNDRRAAVMTLYRVPVHVAVLIVLIRGGLLQKLDNSTIFATAILGLLSGAGAIYYLDRMQGVAQSRSGKKLPS